MNNNYSFVLLGEGLFCKTEGPYMLNRKGEFTLGARVISIKSSYLLNEVRAASRKFDPNFIPGFTHSEGCFYIGLSPDKKYNSGYRVKLSFQIGFHEKDLGLLKLIISYFGVGKISKLTSNSVLYRVTSID